MLAPYSIFAKNAFSIGVSNAKLYLESSTGLQILDISNPINPFLLSTYPIVALVPRGMTVVETTVYIADSRQGLHVLDVSNVTDPQLLGVYIFPTTMQIAAVTVSKAMVYWTGNFGLQIIDTTQGSLTGVPAISDQPMSLTVTARNLTGTLCASLFMTHGRSISTFNAFESGSEFISG